MKIIVFGGSGFIGSHVADVLTEKGYKVKIFDINKSLYLKTDQEMIIADILDYEQVCEAVEDAYAIYNFAGLADIHKANEKPLDTIKFNILGNAHILEAIKKQNIHRYIFASTVYVYSNSGSFYRSSKQACESYIHDYSIKYNIPYTVLRYGSLYGPRADKSNFISQLLKEGLTKKKLTYLGDGEEIRDYIHVEDAARCSVDILDQNFVNQNVILTGHQQIKIKDLLVMVNEMLGSDLKIELKKEFTDLHYEVTPYSFNPKIGKKYISNYYLDMGQGLLQCIEEIHKKLNSHQES